jgi:hypothetical protein
MLQDDRLNDNDRHALHGAQRSCVLLGRAGTEGEGEISSSHLKQKLFRRCELTHPILSPVPRGQWAACSQDELVRPS